MQHPFSYPFRIGLFLICLALILGLAACATNQTGASTEYRVSGVVVLDPDGRSIPGISAQSATANGIDSFSATTWYKGKGYLRVKADTLSPQVDFASAGDTLILKTWDRKASVLIPGDEVEFTCQVQYVDVSKVDGNEGEKAPEFDSCWMTSPVIDNPTPMPLPDLK